MSFSVQCKVFNTSSCWCSLRTHSSEDSLCIQITYFCLTILIWTWCSSFLALAVPLNHCPPAQGLPSRSDEESKVALASQPSLLKYVPASKAVGRAPPFASTLHGRAFTINHIVRAPPTPDHSSTFWTKISRCECHYALSMANCLHECEYTLMRSVSRENRFSMIVDENQKFIFGELILRDAA